MTFSIDRKGRLAIAAGAPASESCMWIDSVRPPGESGAASRRKPHAAVRIGGGAMGWDLGLHGVALLLAMSLGFGVVVQLLLWKATPHWTWLAATAAYFALGIFVSEVWFGWATEEDLQPNIDGLSFDEVMLLTTLMAIPVVFAIWFVTRTVRSHRHA